MDVEYASTCKTWHLEDVSGVFVGAPSSEVNQCVCASFFTIQCRYHSVHTERVGIKKKELQNLFYSAFVNKFKSSSILATLKKCFHKTIVYNIYYIVNTMDRGTVYLQILIPKKRNSITPLYLNQRDSK